jgi:transcriptional regulator with XRE-family HTH domain
MPARPDQQAKATTRLARWRIERGIMQKDLAAAIGLSLTTYRELETGAMVNPPLRYLTNAAIALDVELAELIEPEWLEWMRIRGGTSAPPDRDALWHTAPFDPKQHAAREYRGRA